MITELRILAGKALHTATLRVVISARRSREAGTRVRHGEASQENNMLGRGVGNRTGPRSVNSGATYEIRPIFYLPPGTAEA